MRTAMLLKLLEMLISQIDKEDVNKWLDMGLDVLEEKYKDNVLIVRVCQLIRMAFDVPDND